FWAAAVPGALCVLVAVFGIREKRRGRTASGAELQPGRGSTVQLPPAPLNAIAPSGAGKLPRVFYFVLFAVTLFSLGNSSDMFLVMRAQNAGIPVALAPLLGLVFNLTYTLGSWPAGSLSDHFSRRGSSRRGPSRRGVAAAGYLIFAAVYFVFGRAPSALA